MSLQTISDAIDEVYGLIQKRDWVSLEERLKPEGDYMLILTRLRASWPVHSKIASYFDKVEQARQLLTAEGLDAERLLKGLNPLAKIEDEMDLTEAHIDFMQRLRDGRWLPSADRHQDRVRQQLRKASIIKCVMNPRRWVLTDFGRGILETVEFNRTQDQRPAA